MALGGVSYPQLLSRRLISSTTSRRHRHGIAVFSSSLQQQRRSLAGYSRMLDMGGAPSSMHDKNNARVDASKNCKLQAVCFDFEVLTKYTPPPSSKGKAAKAVVASEPQDKPKLGQDIQPNVTAVQQVANLLNVELGSMSSSKKKRGESNEDDLSLLTNDATEEPKTEKSTSKSSSSNNMQPSSGDIRAKYADKLAKRGVQGGLAEVEHAKHQVEETLKRGDAGGHWAARKVAAGNPVSRQSSWVALTGTGALLQYLTQRSIQIALLPRPSSSSSTTSTPLDDSDQGERMQDFQRQLKDVAFSHLISDGRPGASSLVQSLLEKTKLDPTKILLVSDRDDYLRAAKEASLMTCRIVPPNARRGNISAHFMVPDVPAVQQVVDEVNGISFNAVFKTR